MSGLATFWRGPLPALIRACLASFPAQDAPLTLYSYERDLNLPRGIAWRDAREICPDPSLIERYRVGGGVSLATFSDRFRYEMLSRTEYCWIDADFVALRPWRGFEQPVVWGRQPEAKGKALINNAVLRLPPQHPVLAQMLARARAAEGTDIGWGALGPFLLTEIAETEGVYESSAPPERYYPVAPDEFWRPFDPASRDLVAAGDSDLLHLWSELLRRVGYDFDTAPPRGAFLHDKFAEIGALGRFRRVCDISEIRALIARWNASAPAGAA